MGCRQVHEDVDKEVYWSDEPEEELTEEFIKTVESGGLEEDDEDDDFILL